MWVVRRQTVKHGKFTLLVIWYTSLVQTRSILSSINPIISHKIRSLTAYNAAVTICIIARTVKPLAFMHPACFWQWMANIFYWAFCFVCGKQQHWAGQRHQGIQGKLRSLYPGGEGTVPTEWEPGRAPESVWAFCTKENSPCPCRDFSPRPSGP